MDSYVILSTSQRASDGHSSSQHLCAPLPLVVIQRNIIACQMVRSEEHHLILKKINIHHDKSSHQVVTTSRVACEATKESTRQGYHKLNVEEAVEVDQA